MQELKRRLWFLSRRNTMNITNATAPGHREGDRGLAR
jgi:hypothetical protein